MGLKLARPTYKAPRAAAQVRNNQYALNPAPVRGLDLSAPITHQDPRSAVVLDNFFVRRYGVEYRPGSTRWVSNLVDEVLTLMTYNPQRGILTAYASKLFAATSGNNIYDVTDQQDEAFVPAVSQIIPGQLQPGVFSWTNFATVATNYLCICAAGAGYWTYDAAGGWVDRTASVTGTAGANLNFDFVMVWKNRLWFIENNTTKAWYLPTNAIAGAATAFDFGPLFTRGGDLQALASWTMDSGDGIDDRLVVFGHDGDILVYQGTDPASIATFAIVGRWFAGRVPEGRRFASKYAGDLAFITETGVDYMSRLVQGRSQLDPIQDVDTSRRFNETISQDVRLTRGDLFWSFIWLPSEESAILLTPHNTAPSGYQFCFNGLGQGWSRHVGMAMSCAEEFDGDLYYGTLEGTVIKAFYGYTDDELSDGTAGRSVIGVLQTAFVPPNEDRVQLKRPLLVQTIFTGTAPPEVKVQINTEFTIEPVPGTPSFIPNFLATWDLSLWDVALWSTDNNTFSYWQGATGLGAYASLRMAMQAEPRTVFSAWKLVYEAGGVM